ncbi:unnamed protein product [Paramecium pentaurelia]|uniref:EGF-like domain-containing protein n=1 Tax=Paramecium pentaurelia TaxID=43138 RepID=A0A8S1V8V2_9CILI|nr:unnamed protein product [Paramecium pentaurelia]
MLLIVIFHAYYLTQNILSRQECQTDICICHGSSEQCRCYFYQTPYCDGYGPSQTCSTNPGCLGCDDNSSCIACISQQQFVDSSQNCVDCPEHCLTCTSQSNCQSCLTNYYYLDNGLCKQCEFPCQQCNSQQNCLSCVSQQFYLISSICRLCDPPCLTCLNQTQCLTCIDNSYYLDQFHCVPCQFPCLTCSNQNFCQSCVLDNYKLDNGLCINQCPLNCLICDKSLQCIKCEDGNYLNASNSCVKCQDPCENCLNKEICITCQNQYFLQNQNCIQCQQPCLTCLDQQKCNSCIDGYYLYNQTCNQCSLNCLKCDQFRCYQCNKKSQLLNDQCIDCTIPLNQTLDICNYQDCQDGIWTQGEECDNGNSYGCINCIMQNGYYCINQIGQPSQCLRCIENCIQCNNDRSCQVCKEGYFLNPNNQCQECNKECKTCINQPNNCLSCKISNQYSQQCQLCEINLGYYTDFENNQCYSKCGDNIKTVFEQCDDGNNLNGDGCSSKCQIEDGFYCIDGHCDTLIQGDIQVSQQQANLNTPSKQFVIQFKNYILNSDSDIVPIIQFLNCQINQSLIVVKQNITEENYFQHRVIEINIEFQNNCLKDKMEVSIVQKYKNNNKKSILLSFLTFQIFDILFIEQWKQFFNEIVISFNQTLFYIFGFVCLATFLTGTIEVVYNAIDLIQMFSYLKYINVNLPYNLQKYFDLFKFAQLQYFSNFTKQVALTFLTQKELDQYNYLPDKIKRDGYYSYCLLNYPFLFLIFVFAILLYPMAKLLLRQLQRFQIRIKEDDDDSILLKIKLIQLHIKLYIQKSCQYIINKLYFSGFISTHMILTYDILFVSLLNLFDLKILFTTNNTFILINLYIAILLTIIHCSLLFIYYSMLAKQTYLLEQKENVRKCGSLFEGLKIGKTSCTHFYKLFILIKKSLFMILITFCSSFPYCQSLSISFLSFIQVLYLYNYKPIISMIEYRKQLISEFCVLLLSLFITLLILMHDTHQDMLFYSDILGWSSIILMSMLLLFQIILDIKQQFLICQKKFILFHKILQSLQTKLQKVFQSFGSTQSKANSNVVLFY